MIVLFHTFFIITKYILTAISKSVFCTACSDDGKHKESVFSNDSKNYLMESEAEIEDGIGVRFFPPVYIQRYTAVKHALQDERWLGKIRKVVDFGCAEFGFFIFMKQLPGLHELLAVDIDHEILERNCCRVAPLNVDYLESYQRPEPLVVRVLNGSIADTDPRLLGTDAVVCIELIEHLYPDTLEEVPFTVFGYIKPLVAIFTTPNSDFNVLFPNLSGFRHPDHKFEWTRNQFEEWALNITKRFPAYNVKIFGVGKGPPGTESYGCCSQMAIFIKIDYQSHIDNAHKDLHQEVPEVGESDMVYKEIRSYEFPYHVDNRTNDEKVLQEAEYSIRVLTFHEKYNTENGIYIPLQEILTRVEKWCTSVSSLKNILEDAGWEIFEEPYDNETFVIYPSFDEESSVDEYEDFDMEEQENRSFIQESTEDDWDKSVVDECIPFNDECKDLTMCSDEWQYSGNLENRSCSKDCDWQEDKGFSSHTVKSSLEVCNSSRDNSIADPSDSESVNLKVCSDTSGTISVRTQEVIDDDISKNSTINTQLSSSSSPNSVISPVLGKIPSTDLDSKQAKEQVAPVSSTQIDSCDFAKDLDRHLEMDNSSTSAYSACCDSMTILKNEGCSYNEALTKRKLDELEEIHRTTSHNISSENTRKNKNFSEDLVLDESPQCLFSSHHVNHSQTSIANSSDCNRVNCSFVLMNKPSAEEESEGMSLNFVPGSSMIHQKSSHSLCVGCATPSTLESSQERSLVESYSLDEQNDKAVDSGYPNSFSVQDMDMDLTPEQVDEIYSESEEIASENSNSYSVESDSESDGGNNHDHNRLINNDGFFFNVRNELLYDPMVHAVENGDVANNNRDGEGNNAVADIPLPVEPEIEDQIDHEFIPLLAAAEDFDNDNDLILPEDVQPFPHWLLHLLGLVHPVNGGGDLHQYLQPPGAPGNPLPAAEQNYSDEEVVHSSDSSDLGEAVSDFVGSDLGSDGLNLEDFDEAGVEVVVPGDIGGGGEPDTFQNQQ